MEREKEMKFDRLYKIDSKNYGLENQKNPDERVILIIDHSVLYIHVFIKCM